MAKHISQEEFDNYLRDEVAKLTPAQLLAIPGIYEVLSEALNDDVIYAWEVAHEDDQEELDDDEDV